MAATPESKVKARVVKQLKEMGVYHFSPVTGGFGRSGVFDIVCCVGGVFIGIEVKATSKHKPTLLQSGNAAIAKTAGACVLLIHEDNVHLVTQLVLNIKVRARSNYDSPNKPIQSCVWPFDGVEEGTFKYPE
jgi:hypothetical protein